MATTYFGNRNLDLSAGYLGANQGICTVCGKALPGDAVFCSGCGNRIVKPSESRESKRIDPVLAPIDAKVLKCPSCGAPITPKYGEMIINCRYCSSGITLGMEGWKSIGKHTMLPLKVSDKSDVISSMRSLMNRGLLRRHLQENSKLEELSLALVPYWIVSISARTSIISLDTATQIGTAATTAALIGAMAGGIGGRNRGGAIVGGAVLGSVLAGGMGSGQASRRFYQLNDNHNYPVIAMRALSEFQPHDFEFALQERTLFEASKIPRAVKILNGDVSEGDAKNQARTLVEQLQSQKAHRKYHMIQEIHSELDVGDAELLHVPVWLARYDHKGRKLVLIIDGNSGRPIHSVGLDDDSPEHLSIAS